MSENGAQQTIMIECANPDCKQEVVLVIPDYCTINVMALSAIIWMHPETQICPSCGTAYQMQLKQVGDVKIAFGPVRTKRDSIMIPPPGFKLPDPNVKQ